MLFSIKARKRFSLVLPLDAVDNSPVRQRPGSAESNRLTKYLMRLSLFPIHLDTEGYACDQAQAIKNQVSQYLGDRQASIGTLRRLLRKLTQ